VVSPAAVGCPCLPWRRRAYHPPRGDTIEPTRSRCRRRLTRAQTARRRW